MVSLKIRFLGDIREISDSAQSQTFFFKEKHIYEKHKKFAEIQRWLTLRRVLPGIIFSLQASPCLDREN